MSALLGGSENTGENAVDAAAKEVIRSVCEKCERRRECLSVDTDRHIYYVCE